MKTHLIAAFLSTTSVAMSQSPSLGNGQALFERNCAKCHGKDGTKGRFGAKNLQITPLSDSEMIHIISKGKRVMPSWEHKLAKEEIHALVTYIHQLHSSK